MKEILHFIAENSYNKAIAVVAYNYEKIKGAPLPKVELYCAATDPYGSDLHDFLANLFCAIVDVDGGFLTETSTLIGELAALATDNGSYNKANIRMYLTALRNGQEI